MASWRRGLWAAAAALTLPAWAFTRSCPDVGCVNSISFHVQADLLPGEAYAVRACVDDYCADATVEVPPGRGSAVVSPSNRIGELALRSEADAVCLTLPGSREWSGTRRASLTIRDPGGQAVAAVVRDAPFEASRPNGPGCPPVCWNADVTE